MIQYRKTASAMNDPTSDLPRSRQQIGIAVVERNGRVLVGIRGQQAHLSGKAEFPGGKCEPGETSAACATRECFEETGLRVDIECLLCERDFDYPEVSIHLSFYLCRTVDSEVDAGPGWNWVPIQQLNELNFPEANSTVIKMLTDRHDHLRNLA